MKNVVKNIFAKMQKSAVTTLRGLCNFKHVMMNNKQNVALYALFVFLSFSTVFAQSASKFAKPEQGYRPWVYWYWNNGNITKEGIDADLEAMHRVGIGGVVTFEVGARAPRGPVDYMSDRWRELFSYMMSKASSLGMKVNMHNGPGWCGSGGPWITPENAMKTLSIKIVEVPADNRPEKIVVPHGEKRFDYYRDICVIAFPTPKMKSGLGFLSEDYQRLSTPAHQIPVDAFIPLDAVVDLSEKMNDDGEIFAEIPPGNQTVIRFGVTCKNKFAHPTPASAVGLECDKLSKRGIENAFAGQIAKLIADNRESVGKTFVATHIDSWEVGSQNWTDDMRKEFLSRRKYDLLKFLPIFAGYVMQNPEYTERFLWDFRRTVSELVLENYAGHMRELANQNGLRFTVEGYYNAPCDNLQYAGMSDEPMGEFWWSRMMTHTCRGMASAGHIYGKPVIGSESFTANELERWLAHPGAIKTRGDQAFSEGINRFAFHVHSGQPWKDVRPGMTMAHWGTHYDRTQTWWELTPAWHDYLSRCQYMLRQGEFAADILYLEPEDSPQQFSYHPQNGYQWDQGNTDVVLQATVENGMLVLASGMKYRVLVLPPVNCMTLELLEKTLQLVQDGLTVIGEYRATTAPGLTDYPNKDLRVKELAQKLWGDSKTPNREQSLDRAKVVWRTTPEAWGDIGTTSGEHLVGKGKVVWGTTPEAVLAGMGVLPDFVSDIRLNWIHRSQPDTEIYFVANPRNQAVIANIQLRGLGKIELWNPETGEMMSINALQTVSGTTRMMLPLGATESIFVILRKPQSGDVSASDGKMLASLTKDGKRLFDLTETLGKITVTSAKYGILTDPLKTVDVKPLVEKLVDAGERRIPVSRMLEQHGDPALNTVKTLTIDYEMDGKRYTVTGKDTETLVFGSLLPPVNIPNARYTPGSVEEKTIDIKERLQRFFDRGENNFSVSCLAQPDDPPQTGRFCWELKFDYEFSDRTGTWNGNSWNGVDGITISLEGKTAPIVAVPATNSAGKRCVDFHESGKYEMIFASNKKKTENVSLPQPLNLDNDWNVAFPHKTVKFDKLTSWSDATDDSVRFFSGTATYEKTFTVPKNLRKKGLRIMLDLGQTEIMAELELNGKYLGVLWKMEKIVDITDYLNSGENLLKISVTNLWCNRLIGDAQLPASDERNNNGMVKEWPQWLLDGKADPNGRSTFSMWNIWKADDDPVPSGLIGPVRLMPVKRVEIE